LPKDGETKSLLTGKLTRISSIFSESWHSTHDKSSHANTNVERIKLIIAGIPAYNEERTIASVILRTQKQVDAVVVCDDGSHDMTAEIAQRLGATVIRHETNKGYGAALKSLFEKAQELNADILVTLDADGQHDATEIQALIKPLIDAKADIAIGSRLINGSKGIPLYRRFGIKLITKVTNGPKVVNGSKEEQNLTDAQCGFRAYNGRAIKTFSLTEASMGASLEILIQARDQGLRIAEVPVEAHYDGLDTSTLHPVEHGLNLVGTIIRLVVEERPLLYLGIPAIFFLAVGIVFGVLTLQLYSIEHAIVTNVFLAGIAFILMGMFTLFTAITLFAIIRQRERLLHPTRK
jgi:glycosyltransferase involved in cell wall biosynthesis